MEDYDEKDGKALAMRLMNPGGPNNKKPWKMVAEIMSKNRGLKELEKEFPWLEVFLFEIVKGKMSRARTVTTRLNCLSKLEAKRIGHSLSAALRSRKTAEAGLYQWEKQNRSMVELFERYPWTKAMLLEVSREVISRALWGSRYRLYMGAILSMLDMGTDINMILVYWNTPGMERAGDLMSNLLLANVAWQLLLVIIQNKKAPWRVLLREILYVLTCTKVGVDVYRVASGAKQEAYQTAGANTELGE